MEFAATDVGFRGLTGRSNTPLRTSPISHQRTLTAVGVSSPKSIVAVLVIQPLRVSSYPKYCIYLGPSFRVRTFDARSENSGYVEQTVRSDTIRGLPVRSSKDASAV
jgi:hypothetical protein